MPVKSVEHCLACKKFPTGTGWSLYLLMVGIHYSRLTTFGFYSWFIQMWRLGCFDLHLFAGEPGLHPPSLLLDTGEDTVLKWPHTSISCWRGLSRFWEVVSSVEKEGVNRCFPGRWKSRPWAVAKESEGRFWVSCNAGFFSSVTQSEFCKMNTETSVSQPGL